MLIRIYVAAAGSVRRQIIIVHRCISRGDKRAPIASVLLVVQFFLVLCHYERDTQRERDNDEPITHTMTDNEDDVEDTDRSTSSHQEKSNLYARDRSEPNCANGIPSSVSSFLSITSSLAFYAR